MKKVRRVEEVDLKAEVERASHEAEKNKVAQEMEQQRKSKEELRKKEAKVGHSRGINTRRGQHRTRT
jgi:hypothetical protein